MKLRNILGLSIVAFTLHATNVFALPDVCTMSNSEVRGVQVSAETAAYRAKIAAECELSEKYRQMQMKAQAKYGISLEQITQFQAMRYIRRSDYETAKYNSTPVKLIYQILDEQYRQPETKDTKIWDGFVKGVETLAADRARLQAGGRIEFSDLMRIHRNFYQVSDERGDHANPPSPGRIKSPSANDGHWWRLQPEAVEKTTKLVDEINAAYGELDLLQSGLETLYETPYMTQLIAVKPTKDGTGYGLYGGDSRANEQHLQNILKFVNRSLEQARQTGMMVVKGRLMTPAELAWLTQQFIVQAHPFQDGNGRTTRYLQELILTSFGLPYGSSGDMMDDDVLTPPAAYYATGISSTRALLTSVDECLEVTYPNAMTSSSTYQGSKSDGHKGETRTKIETRPFTSIDQATLGYDCRLLN